VNWQTDPQNVSDLPPRAPQNVHGLGERPWRGRDVLSLGTAFVLDVEFK